ncbi:MAG: DUF1425 domain-containing protein [Pedosphaera sp.]|nr:DUF1425 domain-containing protein [Pedosphaera sp.]
MNIHLLTGVAAISISALAVFPGIGCSTGGQAVAGPAHAGQVVYTNSSGGAYSAKDTDRKNLENQSKFVLLDKRAEESVTYNGIQERPLPDGRLEVAVNMRNRLERHIRVQVQCVFKDIQGFSTGDETPWQSVVFSKNSQETVTFASMNDRAKDYTVRVREAR